MVSYDLNERLSSAVHSGNFQQALSFIMQGAQATYISPTCGRTAVGTAALLGDAELLELLLQSCEEPGLGVFHQNHTDSLEIDSTPDGMDKLEWVDEFEHPNSNEVCNTENNSDDSLYYYYAKTFENTGEFLVDGQRQLDCCASCRQQDAHLMDNDLMTPLHYAASWGHSDCVRILLEHKAPINVVNSAGYTPLHLSAGHVEVMRLLIAHGAPINAKTLTDGKTAMHLAIESRCSQAVQVLLQAKVSLNETDDEGETPLMTAIACNLSSVAIDLIKRGAGINLLDKYDHSALYFAVEGRLLSVSQLLLESGARRLTADHLLHRCVAKNDRPLVELLLKHGDSLCVRNNESQTPILVAIQQQLPEMLAYLLDVAEEHKKKGLYTDCQEQGLLLFAVQNISNLENFRLVMHVLLAKLASARQDLYTPCAPTMVCGLIHCQTPLSRAINLQRLDIAELLVQEGCNIMQICREHVVNELRGNCSPRSLALGRLLFNAGFKFPHKQLKEPCAWSSERKQFEQQMYQLGTKPPTLQSQARLVIRQHLLKQLQTRPALQMRYLPTAEQSTISLAMNELEIPMMLRGYLSEFAELPGVKNIEDLRDLSSWDDAMW